MSANEEPDCSQQAYAEDRHDYEMRRLDHILAAAAPDLLAASELALAAILKHIPATEFAPRDALRAAIAKAKGE